MGVRLYNPATGTFSSVDPVPGGNTTTFTYPQDPVNQLDLDGKRRTWSQRLRLGAKFAGYAAFGVCVLLSAGACAAAGLAAVGASVIYNGYRAHRREISRKQAAANIGIDAVGLVFRVRGINRMSYHGAHNTFNSVSGATGRVGRHVLNRGLGGQAMNSARGYAKNVARSARYSWTMRPRRSAGLAAFHGYYGYRSYRT